MTQILVPDIGDFKDVEVIDVLVKAGDTVAVETALVTLETDKATMDVPSTAAGVVKSLAVKKGDRLSKGSLVLTLEEGDRGQGTGDVGKSGQRTAASQTVSTTGQGRSPNTPLTSSHPSPITSHAAASIAADTADYDYEVVVLGAGPGGYTAAFRAADLGMKVALIERWPTLGGVCLNVGCIPSKALLHAAKVIEDAESMAPFGITFGKPTIDAGKLREWKNKVIGKLTSGLAGLAKQRKVEIIRGVGKFVSPHELKVEDNLQAGAMGLETGVRVQEETSSAGSSLQPTAYSLPAGRRVTFAHCIIAAGSESVKLPGVPDDPRIIDSTGALELDLPKRMLVIGGGIIGLEMATVYDALGVKVSVVELTDGLMPGCDRDLVKPLERRIAKRYEKIMVKTKVSKVEALPQGIRVTFEGEQAIPPELYERVLVAVGRSPNGRRIDADKAGVTINDRGFIPVDRQMRTNVPHILAIGDIVGQPMLAHKATHEGKLAAEVAKGEKHSFDARVIPSVAYTDPEVAWVGLTETDAKAKGIPFEKAQFPWAASGRSLALNRDEGMTKLLFDPATHRVIGGGIVGSSAGDLISEVALAIEMGCDAADIGGTIHPHPTLSETVAFSAEAFEGTLTDLYLPKKK